MNQPWGALHECVAARRTATNSATLQLDVVFVYLILEAAAGHRPLTSTALEGLKKCYSAQKKSGKLKPDWARLCNSNIIDKSDLPKLVKDLTYADGAELVCASVDFGLGDSNPLLRALPTCLVVPLERLAGLKLTQQLLFEEAFRPRCGHDAVVNRLTEVLLIQVLRYAIEHRLVDGGLMAGLGDQNLHKALVAMHETPARN